MKRFLRYALILLVLVIIGAVAANSLGWINSGPEETLVTTEQAEQRSITQLVSASGRLQPETEVIIRPDVSGEIIELPVKEGDYVQQGDLLLRIKPDIYQARIDELNASLLAQRARFEQARANMLQSEIEFLTNKQLFERELISEMEFRQTENAFEAQKANVRATEFQIQSAEAQLRRSREELEQTVIRAPQNGTISRLSVERGERVLGNAQTAGTEMLRIARLDQMEVEVEVNENQVMNVSVGDSTGIEVDAYPERIFDGVVTEVANSADISGSSSEQVTNYRVKVRLTSPHNLSSAGGGMLALESSERPESDFVASFKPGMSANVDIRTETVENAVSIPIQAVTVRDFVAFPPAGDSLADDEDEPQVETASLNASDSNGPSEDFRRVVFINDEGIARRVEVETGISDTNYMHVINGVQPGDEVITGGFRILSRELRDGERIRTQD
jgi:HlyD family secretion protein